MKTLRNSSLLLLLVSLISACQSMKVFRLERFPNEPYHDLHVIQVNSNRVQQKCLFLNAEGDNNWRHQYFLYVLGDRNEVFEIMKSTHTDGKFCRSLIDDVEKTLKTEHQVKICVHDELERRQVSASQEELISFGSLGRHKVTYEGLTFDSICSSKKCVGDNSAWAKTCPGFPKQ